MLSESTHIVPGSPEISVTELRERLAQPAPPQIAEILPPSYFQSGHLPGAINLPLDGFAENARRLLPDSGADIVVYCASQTCNNSDLAARKLVELGYRKVRVFRGGKAAWQAAGAPLEV